MDQRLSLCLVAIVMMIAATSIEAGPTSPPTFGNMRQKLRPKPATSAYAATDGRASMAATGAANLGNMFPRAPRFTGNSFMPIGVVAPVKPVPFYSPNSNPQDAVSPAKAPPRFYVQPRYAAHSSASVGDGARSAAAVMSEAPAMKRRYVGANPSGSKIAPMFASAQASSGAPGTGAEAQYSSGPVSNSYSHARTGAFTDNNNGLMTNTYVRDAESKSKHEEGSEDDENYQKAHSSSKSHDTSKDIDFNHNEEEEEQTPNRFYKKKVSQDYKRRDKSSRNESGTLSEAKQKHSTAFSKKKNKTKENVTQDQRVEGDGVLENASSTTSNEVEEEEEEGQDSRGLPFNPADFKPPQPPAMMAQASVSDKGTTASSAGFAPQPVAAHS